MSRLPDESLSRLVDSGGETPTPSPSQAQAADNTNLQVIQICSSTRSADPRRLPVASGASACQ